MTWPFVVAVAGDLLFMLLSLVICTRNRAEQLRRTLRTAEKLEAPGEPWELLIIDNGSTDHTARVVEDFADRLPIRRIIEREPGLSNARNRGVQEARGRYICWTDDDVLLDRGWLAAYADAFRRHPEASFFGGRVTPVFDGPVPGWFAANSDLLGDLLAARDLGETEARFLSGTRELPYGASFAVRTADQRRHPFDPALGAGRQRLGEESVVMLAMLAEGGHGVWVPAARAEHVIAAARLTLGYVADYYHASGATWAYLGREGQTTPMGPPPPAGRARILGVPLWLWREVLVGGIACRLSWPARTLSRRRLGAWINYHYMRGALSQVRAQAGRKAAPLGAPGVAPAG